MIGVVQDYITGIGRTAVPVYTIGSSSYSTAQISYEAYLNQSISLVQDIDDEDFLMGISKFLIEGPYNRKQICLLRIII